MINCSSWSRSWAAVHRRIVRLPTREMHDQFNDRFVVCADAALESFGINGSVKIRCSDSQRANLITRSQCVANLLGLGFYRCLFPCT